MINRTHRQPLSRQTELRGEYGVPVIWRETHSLNTAGNAEMCWRLLGPQGVRRIAVVTHDWHMRRAAAAFAHTGFSVLPAPTGFYPPPARWTDRRSWLPNAVALQRTGLLLHEVAV